MCLEEILIWRGKKGNFENTLSTQIANEKDTNTSPDFTLIVRYPGTRQAFTETLSCVSSEDLDEDYFSSSCAPWPMSSGNILGYSGTPDRVHYKSSMCCVTWLIDTKNSVLIIWPCCLVFPLSKKKELHYSGFFSGCLSVILALYSQTFLYILSSLAFSNFI